MSASPIAEPAVETAAKSQSSAMLFSDRRHPTEDFIAWQDRMIAAGKMYRPITTSTTSGVGHLQGRGVFDWSLQDVACGVHIGGTDSYEERKNYFCQRMITLNNRAFEFFGITFQGTDSIVMDISLGLGNYFTNEFIANTVCYAFFDGLERECPGSSGGGTATLNVSFDNGDRATGSIENQNYELDNGATCPANPLETQYCEIRGL